MHGARGGGRTRRHVVFLVVPRLTCVAVAVAIDVHGLPARIDRHRRALLACDPPPLPGRALALALLPEDVLEVLGAPGGVPGVGRGLEGAGEVEEGEVLGEGLCGEVSGHMGGGGGSLGTYGGVHVPGRRRRWAFFPRGAFGGPVGECEWGVHGRVRGGADMNGVRSRSISVIANSCSFAPTHALAPVRVVSPLSTRAAHPGRGRGRGRDGVDCHRRRPPWLPRPDHRHLLRLPRARARPADPPRVRQVSRSESQGTSHAHTHPGPAPRPPRAHTA